MIKTVYVQAASKAAINRALADGVSVVGKVYDMGGHDRVRLLDMPAGTVVKVYEVERFGSPMPKAYGTIKRNKAGKVTVA